MRIITSKTQPKNPYDRGGLSKVISQMFGNSVLCSHHSSVRNFNRDWPKHINCNICNHIGRIHLSRKDFYDDILSCQNCGSRYVEYMKHSDSYRCFKCQAGRPEWDPNRTYQPDPNVS